jgi:hypothetical protein
MPHICRNVRCRLKLAEPTDNPRSAFCCRGCFRQHYAKHCIACEQPMEGRSKHHQHPKCRAEYRTLKRHEMLGKYHDSGRVRVDARNPIKPGIFSALTNRRPWRVVAGPPLSAREMHLTTRGGADLDRNANRKHWQTTTGFKRGDPPVNIIGGYRFPNERPVKLTIESDQAKVEAS